MDPLLFLDVAMALSGSDREADRRTSIGRSYYALFNHVRGKVQPLRFLPGNDEDHKALSFYLIKANNRDLQSVGQFLKDLRVSRNQSDYEMNLTVEKSQSELARAQAQMAIDKLNGVGEAMTKTFIQAVPNFVSRPRVDRD